MVNTVESVFDEFILPVFSSSSIFRRLSLNGKLFTWPSPGMCGGAHEMMSPFRAKLRRLSKKFCSAAIPICVRRVSTGGS